LIAFVGSGVSVAYGRVAWSELPATDGRTDMLSRDTEPEADQAILLQQLKLSLPAQPPPRITAAEVPGSA